MVGDMKVEIFGEQRFRKRRNATIKKNYPYSLTPVPFVKEQVKKYR
jgi:hypothetical protein